MSKILKMMLNFYGTILSPNITNEPPHDKTNIMTCAKRSLKSACASAQSGQSSLCAQWVVNDPSFLYADSEDSDQTGRSDWADAQADLSLRWAHMSFGWFCHEAAKMSL